MSNNLTINGAGGVALGSATIVAGTLTLTSGALGVGTNTLTLNGTVTATSGSITKQCCGDSDLRQRLGANHTGGLIMEI